MSDSRGLRLGLAQINPTVGDLTGNVERIVCYLDQARQLGVDLVCFPELAITGYPPEDLLLKPSFIVDNLAAIDEVASQTQGITAIVGFVDANSDIFNAAAILHDGKRVGVYHKQYLPNYGVFDEDRYFQPGRKSPVIELGDAIVGINICEDIWYPVGPAVDQALAGAQLIVNVNASPYHAGKRGFRHRMLATRAADNAAIVAYVNMVGGQDELVFDGNSLVFDQQGNLIVEGVQFAEELLVVDLDLDAVFRTRLHDPRRRKEHREAPDVPRLHVERIPHVKPPLPPRTFAPLEGPAEVYAALVTGTRDYVEKNGSPGVLISLSGGIDSSLVAVIATDALGADRVTCVSMPSRFTSEGTKTDAEVLAQALGVRFLTIPIEPAFETYLEMLAGPFAGTKPGTAEENLQARIRGNIMMALANKGMWGWLVLTTGNKSEMATGYATLYGDMAGGFAVIKDVPKTMVYELARYRNSIQPVIPESVLTREPSAELRPNQRDSDSLPPYPILDPIVRAYVEEDRSREEIVAMGYDEATVHRVIQLVDQSEYKRRQAPPGIKITPRAFGRDRRLPITNRYRG